MSQLNDTAYFNRVEILILLALREVKKLGNNMDNDRELNTVIEKLMEVRETIGKRRLARPTTKDGLEDGLRRNLTNLLNTYSIENGSNTPDHCLSLFLLTCLAGYEEAVNTRDRLKHPK